MNAPTTVTIPTDPEQLMSEVIGRVLSSIEPYVEERDKDPNGMVALAVAAATMGLAKVMQHDLPAQRTAPTHVEPCPAVHP